MKIRFLVLVVGVALVDAGCFLVYRPLSLVVMGALLIAIAARGGK